MSSPIINQRETIKDMVSVDTFGLMVGEEKIKQRCEQFSGLLAEAKDNFKAYADHAGWMTCCSSVTEDHLQMLESLAKEIRDSADVFVLIGVGGSNNAARAMIEALKNSESNTEIIYAGNSTDPDAIESILSRLENRSVYINVIAKNFETLEPGIAFRVIRQFLYNKHGESASKRIIATGTSGSRLNSLSIENGWRFLEFPDNIGGRYSAFSDVALLPIAVAGINIRQYLNAAEHLKKRILELPPSDNPAMKYAAIRTLLYEHGYRVEMLSSFSTRFSFFARWWIQLFGESEGKCRKGLFPASAQYSEELHSIGQYLQDGTKCVFETFLAAEQRKGITIQPDCLNDGFSYLDGKSFRDLNLAAARATLNAHSQSLPCLLIKTGPVDSETFGELYMFFMLSCVFSCRMMGVDPFDQPGVEEYKKSMFLRLGKEK